MNTDVQYRLMRKGEEEKICSLVKKVFHEFVAPDYGEEGINEFFKFANPRALAERSGPEQVVVVAEQGSDLLGMIEILKCEHIALLFVSNRGKGIAKQLISRGVEECSKRQIELKRLSVNSSPFAKPIYAKLGFKKTGPVQEKNGITFVPMARILD